MQSVRPAAVAGLFYPGTASILVNDLHTMLNNATQAGEITAAKAIIVPHAGYVYSGPVAASAYALLQSVRSTIRRVILLGPAHRVAFRGLALPGVEAFATPLGNIPLDLEAAEIIAHLPQVSVNPQAHAQEHSLEVQLPFLQSVLENFSLLPLVVGMSTAEEVAEILELLWGGNETLFVISSDLSHYLPYDKAKSFDNASVQNILKLGHGLTHEQACGATPINGLILAARKHHLAPHLVDLRNSGDTAGPREGVVGYASLAFTEERP